MRKVTPNSPRPIWTLLSSRRILMPLAHSPELARPIEQLNRTLDDTIMLSGSEAYVAALAYYNSVKRAAKINVPGALTIHEDLKKRFDR